MLGVLRVYVRAGNGRQVNACATFDPAMSALSPSTQDHYKSRGPGAIHAGNRSWPRALHFSIVQQLPQGRYLLHRCVPQHAGQKNDLPPVPCAARGHASP
jgi:hypothetical protein